MRTVYNKSIQHLQQKKKKKKGYTQLLVIKVNKLTTKEIKTRPAASVRMGSNKNFG